MCEIPEIFIPTRGVGIYVDTSEILDEARKQGLTVLPDGTGFRIGFREYLRLAARLKDDSWNLVHRPLLDGMVWLSAEQMKQILHGFSSKDGTPKVSSHTPDETPTDLKLIPPCMRSLLLDLQAGKNVTHAGRFAVTAFLGTTGMHQNDVIRLFSHVSDFREDITRYHVSHVFKGRYLPPSCANLKSGGFCPGGDELCCSLKHDGTLRVTNPLNYYRFKVWKRDNTSS